MGKLVINLSPFIILIPVVIFVLILGYISIPITFTSSFVKDPIPGSYVLHMSTYLSQAALQTCSWERANCH
jgi:hypothetical protein